MNTPAKHILKGQAGEQIAVDLLLSKGYTIAARNFRAGKGEIDIIAWQNNKLLVFIEVKTRTDDRFGGPEEAVTVKKQKLLARTAGAYMESIGYDWAVRFDVIAVLMHHDKVLEIRHHEDAFFWM